jgi:hypothetical protein
MTDERYLRESILNLRAQIVAGYPPIMPPYEGQITEEGGDTLCLKDRMPRRCSFFSAFTSV